MIIKLFSQLKIRTKFSIAMITVLLCSFAIFTIVNNHYLTKETLERQQESLTKTLKSTQAVLENTTTMVKYASDIFVDQNYMKDYMLEPESAYLDSPGLYSLHNMELDKQLDYILQFPNVKKVNLFLSHGIANTYPDDKYLSLDDYRNTDWYKEISVPTQYYKWILGGVTQDVTSQRIVSLVRKIPDSHDLLSLNGVVALSVPISKIDEILSDTQLIQNSQIFLTNSSGILISSAGTDNPYMLLSELPTSTDSINNLIRIRNEQYLVGVVKIQQSDWQLSILIPYNTIIAQKSKLFRSIFVTLLLILPIFIIITYVFSVLLTAPINKLIAHMHIAELGDFNIPIVPYSKDEIGQLNRSFNTMVTKLSFLMDEKYRLGKEKKNAQLKALQVQINPHFLYNTLDMINMMAINGQFNRIQEAIQALSRFYRLSLNSGSDKATLSDEIDHIRYYVAIQNFRFDDAIKLDINVDDTLLQCIMFKICLQPLVENAILHGIREKDNESGTIKINAWKKEHYLIITISDDGVGMNQESIQTLLHKTPEEKSGYGVYNVMERIKINYGEDCGLSYSSTLGKGTTVQLKILLKYSD